MTKRGDFWCVRKISPCTQKPGLGEYGNSKIISISPYRVVPHFQGTDKRIREAQSRGL